VGQYGNWQWWRIIHARGDRRLRRMANESILHPTICMRLNNNSEKIKIVFRVQVQIFAQIFFLNVLKIVKQNKFYYNHKGDNLGMKQ
jgi:hypothetical protein